MIHLLDSTKRNKKIFKISFELFGESLLNIVMEISTYPDRSVSESYKIKMTFVIRAGGSVFRGGAKKYSP